MIHKEALRHTPDKLKAALAGTLASAALILHSPTAEATPVPENMSQTIEDCATNYVDDLEKAWCEIEATREGEIDVAIYNNVTGEITRFNENHEQTKTASIVKLSILAKLSMLDPVWVETNQDYIKPMITMSDNGIASNLWNKIGGETGAQEFFNQLGALETDAGGGGYWGATLTTSLDQLKVVNLVSYPNTNLPPEHATVANNFMHQVIPGQQWGISGGVPKDVSIGVKNGWYPHSDGWTVNSIGHVQGRDADYTIAILTKGSPTHQYGIETAELLAAAAWNNVDSKMRIRD